MNTENRHDRLEDADGNRKNANMKHREIQADPIVSRRRAGETGLDLSPRVRAIHKRKTDYSSMYKIFGIVGVMVVILILIFTILLPRAIDVRSKEAETSSLVHDEGENSNKNGTDLEKSSESSEKSSDVSVLNNGGESDTSKVAEEEAGEDLKLNVDKVAEIPDGSGESDEIQEDAATAVDSQSNEDIGTTKTDGYTLSTSNVALLSTDDLEGLTQSQLELARNEIYARHGRIFTRSDLQKYFEQKSWYQGTIEPQNFSDSLLSDVEKKNANIIAKYEQSKGYR